MQTKQIPNWVAGSLLEEILSFNGEISPVEGKIEIGEEVIGEMSQFEKILYSLSEKFEEDVKKAGEEHEGDFHQCGDKNPVCLRLKIAHDKYQITKNMMWNSVEQRLQNKGQMAIRENYKIVSVPDSITNGSLGQMLLGALMMENDMED